MNAEETKKITKEAICSLRVAMATEIQHYLHINEENILSTARKGYRECDFILPESYEKNRDFIIDSVVQLLNERGFETPREIVDWEYRQSKIVIRW